MSKGIHDSIKMTLIFQFPPPPPQKNEFSTEKLSFIYSKSDNLEFKIIGKIMQFWIYLKYIIDTYVSFYKLFE